MHQSEIASNRQLLIVVLGLLTCLGPMAIDLYLPAMPNIARSMGEPLGNIQQTLSTYTIGFAVGQVIFGPLSDRFGRLNIILPGLIAYIATNLMAAMTDNSTQLITVRVIQALAGASVMVCIPAIVRDLYHSDECARILSSILLVMTVAPLLAPIIGGQILLLSSWPSLFLFLAGLGGLAFVLALLKLEESLPKECRMQVNPVQLLQVYKGVLTHKQAMSCILAHGFFFAGMFAFISASPFVYIELYGVPAERYGFLFALNIIAMAVCNLINMRLMASFPLKNLLLAGCGIACISGFILLFNAKTGFGGLPGIVIPVIMFIGVMGFSGPNSNALALSHFPRTAGTANATAGVIRFGLGGISAGLAGVLHNGTAMPMAVIMAGCGVLSLVSLLLLGRNSDVAGSNGLQSENLVAEAKTEPRKAA